MTRKALGRGLRALIPEAEPLTPAVTAVEAEGPVTTIPVDRIRRSRHQPRQHFDPARLEELASSIRQKGLLQPILVRRSGDSYELIAGERRLRAAVQAGLTEIPALVRDLTDGEAAEVAIIENVQREDLDPIEKAKAFKRLQEEFGLTQDLISERIGSDRSSVANFMRLLQLPVAIQAMVSRGTLSMGHARALVTMESAERQAFLATRCSEEGWSVRELERAVREAARVITPPGRKASTVPRVTMSADDADLVNRAQHHLGTKVHLKRVGARGELSIEFYSDNDLERILRRIGVLPPNRD